MIVKELAIFTDNVQTMTDFYASLVGSEPAARSEDMAIFQVGEIKILIHKTYTSGEGELPPENHTGFQVKDLDAACKRLIERGLVIERHPQDYPWGRSAYLRDPAGHQIEIMQEEK
ncbi:MAG: hypothetical protein GWO41_07330 [candidate division Zixibacteria bacterium]|nr:hypothetical protein [candidate division Zixibacteria bacterium]NIS44987.1 hypothetical protein [candidate division Zixibacteria bacterium]NIT52540.1 hypothetical protein [candidate division Zixibacteria bacterium]NIU13087.1 hypothetical protein [candidate division Zixibacteria bacterium]NIV05148.1 hypothetical protein [candidate division Zixibacteria bacterium]